MLSEIVVKKLEAFLSKSASSAYFEEPSELHTNLTRVAWERAKPLVGKPEWILDIGCGAGVFMDLMVFEGFEKVYGMTCLKSEHDAVFEKHPGRVFLCDMHVVAEYDSYWELIWLRHTAEHSAAPAFLLSAAYDALKPGGCLYMEVPAPNTTAGHDTPANPNHYSVFDRRMWQTLLYRQGFVTLDEFDFNMQLACGPDRYMGFLVKKPLEK